MHILNEVDSLANFKRARKKIVKSTRIQTTDSRKMITMQNPDGRHNKNRAY